MSKSRGSKAQKRKEILHRRRIGFLDHVFTLRRQASKKGFKFELRVYPPWVRRYYHTAPPKLPPELQFLQDSKDFFSTSQPYDLADGHMKVPKVLSLLDNYQESCDFLKHLYLVLSSGKAHKVVVDYQFCQRIDCDASVCMDLLVQFHIQYLKQCRAKNFPRLPEQIYPVNVGPEIQKVLFTVGAFKTLKGWEKKYKDIEALPLLIGNKHSAARWSVCEVHTTRIVEYINKCLQKFSIALTVEVESSLYKVLGEIMTNAEEHGSRGTRYALGLMQEMNQDESHHGIFNFTILNFGNTIYDTFKHPDCPVEVKMKMDALSHEYTDRGWFLPASFEEETLWTLYALQEGVTSKPAKRGTGCIQYIENFFRLKGDMDNDNMSRMTIVSGNTRILFDGTYSVLSALAPDGRRTAKTITFNTSGRIADPPDKRYVTFDPHYFPGTLISARIVLKENQTNSDSETQRGDH